MKKSELREAIREIVTEEMYKVLPGIIKESIKNVIRQGSSPVSKAPSVHRVNENVSSNIKGISVNRKALNEILSNTAQEGQRNQPSPLNEGMTFSDPYGHNSVSANALPSHLTSAFTRNYSEVLKKANEKTNRK